MINLKNKSVVVTGGTKGIGIEITKSFLKQNAKVFVLARQKPKRTIQAKGNKAKFVECDIRNIDSLDAAVKQIKGLSKSIDVLINNAGGAPMANALKASNKFHEAIIDLNLSAPLNVSQRFAKMMIKQKTVSNIINISSVAGLMGNPGQVNYSASKAGLGGFTRALAKEVAARNITVNCIAPGFIETDMTNHFKDEELENILNQIPANKMGNPKHVADLALFLASSKGNYITGQTISVDGGLYMS